MDDIRPPGTVEVKCSHPGCNWYFWLSPDDPRLPNGPFFCGSTHEDDRQAQLDALVAMHGIRWGSRNYAGPRSDGKESTCGYGGQRAGYVTFRDKWDVCQGVLRYEDISLLDDPRAIPDLITWHPPSFRLNDDLLPVREEYPRMGGSHHSILEDGTSVEHKLVLHSCPRCQGMIPLEADHPLAFKGTPTCGDATCFSGYTRPCPAGEPAHELDKVLEAHHGPGTCWTMWDGQNHPAKNLAEQYARGQILLRKMVGDEFRFALLTYKNPGEILRFAPHLRFDLLENLPLSKDGCECCEFGPKALQALPFVKLLN